MNKLKKITISIKGMHCTSCEILIEGELKKIPEIEKANIDHHRGVAEIYYSKQKPNPDEINNAIRQAGYESGQDEVKSWMSRDLDVYKDLGIAAFFLICGYVILKTFGLINFNIGSPSSPQELGAVLLIGLTAGVSTCLALVGSMVLGLSANHASQHPEATSWQKFRPHLFFNAGRILSYFVLGGILGVVGSLIQLNNIAQGILMVLVGLVMLLTGLKLVGIFPILDSVTFTLPKKLSEFLGVNKGHNQEYSHSNSFWLGAVTFFLPCGFTQAMQLLAITAGSFWAGSMVMGVFALGTTAGLLAVGGITSLVTGTFARRFFKFAGLVVIILSLFNISNGINLTGWKTAFGQTVANVDISDPNVTLVDGVQEVRMTEGYGGYSPNKFTIQKNVPVKWIIDAEAPGSCAASLIVPDLKIQKILRAGENVIEFTPTEVGRLQFSCVMGMYTGVFNVVDGTGGSSNNTSVTGDDGSNSTGNTLASGSCNMGGGGCGCGGGSKLSLTDSVASDDGKLANTEESDINLVNDVQVIKTVYTRKQDIYPNNFTIQANKPVRLEIDAEESGSGCMSSIMIPGLFDQAKYLKKGEKIVMEFTPTKTGTYQITCAMGVPRGQVVVQ